MQQAGEPVVIAAAAEAHVDLNLEFYFPYWHPPDTGLYVAEVRSYPVTTSSRDPRERLVATLGTDTLRVPEFYSPDCWKDCCTDTAWVKSRWYAGATIDLAGVYAAKAKLAWKKPKMCASPTSFEHDVSFVWFGVANQDASSWCQAGFFESRPAGDNESESMLYVETKASGPPRGKEWDLLAPSPGPWDFKIELDPATGIWTFSFGDIFSTFSDTIFDSGWIDNLGERIDLAGEILHHETDMYGKINSPMLFEDISWHNGSYWQVLLSEDFMLAMDDSTQWKSERTLTGIKIYDLMPLP